MSDRKSIRQDDKERAVLTELIPYEVPLRLTFAHFYSLLKQESTSTKWVRKVFFEQSEREFVPYCYSVRSGEGKRRHLGLIHPMLFRSFADTYNSNRSL